MTKSVYSQDGTSNALRRWKFVDVTLISLIITRSLVELGTLAIFLKVLSMTEHSTECKNIYLSPASSRVSESSWVLIVIERFMIQEQC